MSEQELGTEVVGDEAYEEVSVLRMALERGDVDVDVIERLVALQERTEERRAEQLMNEALAEFKRMCPKIRKTKASGVTKLGAKKGFYAPLDEVAADIEEPLLKCGLHYTWNSETVDGMEDVLCTLRHVAGASRVARVAMPEAEVPGATKAQDRGGTLAYGQRYSLFMVLGLSAGLDTDGAPPQSTEPITKEQEADLWTLISELEVHQKRFLDHLGIEKLSELPAAKYAAAVADLERKRKTG